MSILLIFLACAMSTAFAGGPLWTDDYGDSAAEAGAISPDGGSLGGIVNVDIDYDWFSFGAMPGIEYSISVTDGTIGDTDLALIAPDAVTGLYVTNTAAAGSPAAVVWSNAGTRATCYVRVNGVVEYTTGTYSVAVTRLNFTDSDGDGMPDSWEMGCFGNLTNEAAGDVDDDGLNNIEEYYIVTSPVAETSGLFVATVVRSNNSSIVTWPAALNGTYRVQVASAVSNGAGWTDLVTTLNSSGQPQMSYSDAAGATATTRFYRVQFVY